MNGKYLSAREAFGQGYLSWTGDRIVAQLVSAAYRFDESHMDASDLSGKVGASVELAEKTIDDGWANCAKMIFREVMGDQIIGVVFHREGKKKNGILIAYIDSAVNFPMMPNGGDIELDVDSPGIFRI